MLLTITVGRRLCFPHLLVSYINVNEQFEPFEFEEDRVIYDEYRHSRAFRVMAIHDGNI